MKDHPTPQPSGRTARDILDMLIIAEHNHAAREDTVDLVLFDIEYAQRQLFDAICSEVIGEDEAILTVPMSDNQSRSVGKEANELRAELRQRLRVFFNQPTTQKPALSGEDTNQRFLAQPPILDLGDGQAGESG